MVFNLTSEGRGAFAAGVAGVGTGGLQLIVTRAGDQKAWFGKAVSTAITNGQLINLGVGVVATTLGFIGIMGRGGALGRHGGFSAWLLGHGFTALIGGVAVPVITSAITNIPNSYAATMGPYPPPQRTNPLSAGAPMATQRNISLIRALRA